MTLPSLPAQGSTGWFAWASAVHAAAATEGIVYHDGTTGGGTRPTGYFRVRWIGGTARPTNMVTGDVWERDA